MALVLVGALWASLPAPAAAGDEIVKRVGRVTFRVDPSQAFPGGVVVVRLGPRPRLGSVWALLDGRRAPFYPSAGVPRALVPVAATTAPGPGTLGIGIAARSGQQRVAIPLTIGPRAYPRRPATLPASVVALLDEPAAAVEARRLLGAVRTESREPEPRLVFPPVGSPGSGFGEVRVYDGVGAVEGRTDGLLGDYHRGLDYALPPGTPVRAPGTGTVLLAGSLALTGGTVVLDHGQGVVSVLGHLSRVDAREGDAVSSGAFVGLSGDTGLTSEPGLEWRVYLHEVPVDPTVLLDILGPSVSRP
jgi:murein DD-endopeptidase MepM/ murein hydrolase activator NlpD